MAAKSSIARLAPEIKAHLEQRLAEGRMTLDELIADVQAAFPTAAAEGALPSRSAVHRYGLKLDRRLSAIRASTEAAKMIQAQAGDDKDARSEALTALIQTELFDAILDIQEADNEDIDSGERISMLSNAAKNIATLTRSSVNLKQYQAVWEEKARKRFVEEQRAALASAEKTGGVSVETKQAIRDLFGIG